MIDTLAELSVTIIVVGVSSIGVWVNVKVVMVTSALVARLLVVSLSSVMEETSPCDNWTEAVIDIDVSIDRRIGKLIGALARVYS